MPTGAMIAVTNLSAAAASATARGKGVGGKAAGARPSGPLAHISQCVSNGPDLAGQMADLIP